MLLPRQQNDYRESAAVTQNRTGRVALGSRKVAKIADTVNANGSSTTCYPRLKRTTA
jgi:hypothetical protein